MRSSKVLMLTVILITMISISFAIESTLTFKGGVSQAETDIYQDKQMNGLIGISYEIWMTKWMSLGLNPYITRVQAGPEDGANFMSSLVGGDLLFRIRPNWKTIAPYITFGGGIVEYYPKTQSGEPIDGYPEDYESPALVAPVGGGGITIFTGHDIDFDFGFQKNFMLSDQLEGWEKGEFNDSYWMAFLGVSHTFGKVKEIVEVKPVEIKPEPMLMVSQYELRFAHQAGKKNFDIAANLPWSAQTSDTWFTVSPLSGTGDATVSIKYEANKALAPRTGKILITGGNFNKVINVYQEEMQVMLNVTPSVYQVNNAAGTAFFAIESNSAWTATENADWFTILPINGTGNSDLEVTYKQNPSPSIRVGQIYISSGPVNQTISITQDRSTPAPIPDKKPMILKGVNFHSGSAELMDESFAILDEAAASLAYYSDVEVEIQGHTDSTGSMKINKKLSLDRAITVKAYLITKGVAENRMTVKGFGPDNPIAPNDTPEGRAENRRIEFIKTN